MPTHSGGPRPRTSSPTCSVAARAPVGRWCGSRRSPTSLPSVRSALAAGEISLAQAGVIGWPGRHALPQVPELREQAADKLLGLVAEHGYDATDLDQAFPAVVRELDPDGSLLSARPGQGPRRTRRPPRPVPLRHAPTPSAESGSRATPPWRNAELVKATLMPLSAPVVTEPGACGGDAATGGFELRRARPPGRTPLSRPRLRPHRQGPPRPRRADVGRARRGLPPPPGHRRRPARPRRPPPGSP